MRHSCLSNNNLGKQCSQCKYGDTKACYVARQTGKETCTLSMNIFNGFNDTQLDVVSAGYNDLLTFTQLLAELICNLSIKTWSI